MNLSYDLFDAIRSFDNLRRLNREDYLQWTKANEGFKGSERYSRERAAAEAKRKAADDLARETARKKIKEYLQKMRVNIDNMQMPMPTQEQVAMLQILSLRSNLTIAEIDRAARNLNGNRFALAALQDIAEKHFPKTGHDKNPKVEKTFSINVMKYAAADLDNNGAESILNNIVEGINEILRYPVKKTVLDNAERGKRMYGRKYHIDDLPQRGELVSERQFYNEYVPEEHYEKFMKAVNG